jgi:hypothetical protein
MAEHFDPEHLAQISGAPVTPPMMALMRDEKLRNTQIEVQTDSTVRPDRAASKAEAVEFITSVAQYLGAALPIGQALPPAIPLLIGMLKKAAGAFEFGRQVEDELDALASGVAAMPPAMPGPGAGPMPPGNGAAPAGPMQ